MFLRRLPQLHRSVRAPQALCLCAQQTLSSRAGSSQGLQHGAPRSAIHTEAAEGSSDGHLTSVTIDGALPEDSGASQDNLAEQRKQANKKAKRERAKARKRAARDATSDLQEEDWGVDVLQYAGKNVPAGEAPSTSDENARRIAKLKSILDPTSQAPKSRNKAKPARSKPSTSLRQLAYKRRIEGLLEPSAESDIVLEDVAPRTEHKPIARLAHGLDRVLFNPGVHWMRDPRSHVYNFSPALEHLPKVTDFAFDRIEGFVKSSRDDELRSLAQREKKPFAGSTSSLTGMLSHVYFLISQDREVDISPLSRAFKDEPVNFTPGQRTPTSTVFNYKDGVYMIDSDEDKPGVRSEQNILTWMGTLLEKYFTMEPEEFTRYLRAHDRPEAEGEGEPMREAYRYSKSDNFLMRSQLDCVDPRLPGTGVFDMKTRACMAIRMDLLNFEENSGYLIRKQHGLLESFEREYYDLIRSAFLKYNFQARIGNMDGIFCAYHNVARVFGFQYFGLEEIDARLFGTEPGAGARVFRKCVAMLELVAQEVADCFPKQSVKCTWETLEGSNTLRVWVQPALWDGLAHDEPIVELDVTSSSYLGNGPVKGYVAVAEAAQPWTIHYTISRSSEDYSAIRDRLAGARERQTFAYNLPTGISGEQITEFLENLNFGGVEDKVAGELMKAYAPDLFRKASRTTSRLRALAREGREETLTREKEERGKPKIVLGLPYPPEGYELVGSESA